MEQIIIDGANYHYLGFVNSDESLMCRDLALSLIWEKFIWLGPL